MRPCNLRPNKRIWYCPMSVFRIRIILAALCLNVIAQAALAQTAAPLALPPSAAQDQAPIVITAPEDGSSGLALAPPPPPPPVIVTPPVEIAPLNTIKKDSIGTLSNDEGGLGAGLWKGTSRVFVEHFLPMLTLPSVFPSLNNLAERFLLTTAAAPEGTPGSNQTLTAMRVDKLVALGKASEAWVLASLASPDQIDTISLRQAAEAALVSPAAADVCAKLPAIVEKNTGSDWLKLMIVCQLQAKDVKAAQVSLDLLHTQDAHDEAFFALAEKNIIAGGKNLPRQLTPLTALNLALLRLTDLPIRGEVYARPDPALVPELLKTKASDDNARLALAERAAAKGIINATDLAAVYSSQTFSADALSGANIAGEQGPMLRALLYQASQQEKSQQNRVNETVKFLQSLDTNTMSGSILPLMSTMLGEVQPASDFNANAAAIARIYLLAGKTINAVAWIDFAKGAARGMPQVASDMQSLWPMVAFAGLESDKDFANDLDVWLTATLHTDAQQDASDARTKKATASALLLLLDAAGFPVSDDAWAKCADAAVYEKIAMPPAFVMDRLRKSAAAAHKGEAIVIGLLATAGGKDDPPLLATVETIRALRTVGLTNDAGNLAKDAAVKVMNATPKP